MDYPNTPWSKYIDRDFSYSNIVQPQKSNDSFESIMIQALDCNQLSLEPRLQEYIRKRKFYAENNIQVEVPIEKEFQITNNDLKIIKAFFQGRRDMYEQGNKEFNELNKNKKKKKQYFESKSYRDDDPRVQKINPIRKDKPANLGMFVPDDGDYYYESDIRDVDEIMDYRDLSDTNKNINKRHNKHFNSRLNPYIDSRTYDKSELLSQYKVNRPSKYDDYGRDPRNRYTVNELENNNLESENIKTHTRYGETARPSRSGKSRMDKDNKRSMSTQDYVFGLNKKKTLRNADCETELMRGVPHHTLKTCGYRNPQEHYFDYIDDDLQNPDDSTFELGPRGGASTRLTNRVTARPRSYTREIIN